LKCENVMWFLFRFGYFLLSICVFLYCIFFYTFLLVNIKITSATLIPIFLLKRFRLLAFPVRHWEGSSARSGEFSSLGLKENLLGWSFCSCTPIFFATPLPYSYKEFPWRLHYIIYMYLHIAEYHLTYCKLNFFAAFSCTQINPWLTLSQNNSWHLVIKSLC